MTGARFGVKTGVFTRADLNRVRRGGVPSPPEEYAEPFGRAQRPAPTIRTNLVSLPLEGKVAERERGRMRWSRSVASQVTPTPSATPHQSRLRRDSFSLAARRPPFCLLRRNFPPHCGGGIDLEGKPFYAQTKTEPVGAAICRPFPHRRKNFSAEKAVLAVGFSYPPQHLVFLVAKHRKPLLLLGFWVFFSTGKFLK